MPKKKRTFFGEGAHETSLLGDDSKVGNFARGLKGEMGHQMGKVKGMVKGGLEKRRGQIEAMEGWGFSL